MLIVRILNFFCTYLIYSNKILLFKKNKKKLTVRKTYLWNSIELQIVNQIPITIIKMRLSHMTKHKDFCKNLKGKLCCVFETFVEFIMRISRNLDNTGRNNNFHH